MAHYRIYLADYADFVQRVVSVNCDTDDEAVAYAKTLIKAGGQASLWNSDISDRLLIDSLALSPGLLDTAAVRRSRGRYVT